MCRLNETVFPDLMLPEVIYAAPGIETNLYFQPVLASAVPQNYAFQVICEAGRQESRRWTWIPEKKDAGRDFPLRLSVYDDRGLVIERSCRIRTAPEIRNRDRKVTLALLGDSLINCRYPEALAALMQEQGFRNYTPVGSFCDGHPPKEGEVAHDGLGGYAWESFLIRWAYSEREVAMVQLEAEKQQMREFGVVNPRYGEHLLKSPLLRLENGRTVLDIQNWFCRINHGNAPDFILIELGGNDVFGCHDDREIEEHLRKTVLPSARKVLDALREKAPQAEIGVALGLMDSGQDGFGANYGCTQSAYQYRRNKYLYLQELGKMVKERQDPKMSVFPLYHNMDPETGFMYRMQPANARSQQTERRCINALHPSLEGGLQIADAVFCWLMSRWNLLP